VNAGLLTWQAIFDSVVVHQLSSAYEDVLHKKYKYLEHPSPTPGSSPWVLREEVPIGQSQHFAMVATKCIDGTKRRNLNSLGRVMAI
jgi:hypothetical protein